MRGEVLVAAQGAAGRDAAAAPEARARRRLLARAALSLAVSAPLLWALVAAVLMFALPRCAHAQVAGLPALNASPGPNGSTTYTLSIQTMLVLTMLSFLPAMILMMTSFTRIIIVLSLLRQAIGTTTTPPNQVLVGMALFLTLFVMSPVLNRAYNDGYKPFAAGTLPMDEAVQRGVAPFKTFMLRQTRESDLALFARISHAAPMQGPEDVPLSLLVPAFVTSEMKTGFQIGFTIFIPFLIIDIVVASVLMSMGMMMVSPTTISLPFKLMLFVLVDGWQLLIGSLAQSFS
ncbi:flagellar biosynthetic protein FliP [Burkholderia sp. WAC0059]|nr:flagellar biosynthetic protein FliP [Burkholderia sp. WAC0059]